MKNTLTQIPVEKMHPFMDHPFQVRDDADMNILIESIQQNGILTPLVVRPKENTVGEYEIVSGHRRHRAATKAGLKTLPAFIMPLSREEAIIAMVDSNLQREHVLPSEKAWAYKMKMEALAHRGRGLANTASSSIPTSDQVGLNSAGVQTRAVIGSDFGDSGTQVQRYVRLTNLIKPLLDLVDAERIAFTPAVELSYLKEDEQRDLLETMESEDCTPSLSQALKMKALSKAGKLDMDTIFEIMTQEKANQKEYLKLSSEKYDRFLGRYDTPKDKEAFIMKALEHYTNYLVKQRQRSRDDAR